MMRIRVYLLLAVFLGCAGSQAGFCAESKAGEGAAAPDFKQVYDLIRAHLAGTSDAQLNETAVQALISKLAPRVALVKDVGATNGAGETPLVSKSSVFNGDIAYVRVARVGEGLAKAISTACKKSSTTNKLDGVVVDLRYAGGDDYAAAAAAVDLFAKKEQPLFNWGTGMVRSKEKSDAIGLPVAVLVNGKTAGAAEALAAALRETGSGLILGSRTAGLAMVTQDFPLKNGEQLRIATAPIELGNGTVMSEKGLAPDIAVAVSPADERAYYANAFKVIDRTNLMASAGGSASSPGTGTNPIMRRPRLNEAELVREQREGVSEADLTAMSAPEPEKPLVQDPALARALDLLRGLALVRQSRP